MALVFENSQLIQISICLDQGMVHLPGCRMPQRTSINFASAN